MPTMTGNRSTAMRILAFAGVAGAIILMANGSAALASQSPFGIATPDSTGPAFTGPLGGFFVWVALRQAEFYRILTATLAELKGSGHAFWLLAGISFLYGIFHAVGPGHGKAVITSYLLVARQTVRRGILISFAAALVQGLTAVTIVLIAAVILRVTAIGMTQTTDWFVIFSYGLVAAVGAWLLWSKATGRGHHHHAHAHAHDHTHPHNHHHADHDHGQSHAAHEHDHGHEHHDTPVISQSVGSGAAAVALPGTAHAHIDHSHAPDPHLLSQPLTLSRAWAAILAVGIRPCSGAIIVLVFALSQKLLLAGIASVLVMSLGTAITVSSLAATAVFAKDMALRYAKQDSATTERIIRALEICGAAFVLFLGLTLLGGALAGGLPS
jgi:nickel/cobalt transporter (NicO) family protein